MNSRDPNLITVCLWSLVFGLAAGALHAQPNDQVTRLPSPHEVPVEQTVTEDVVEESLEEVIAPPWYTYDVFFDSSTWESSFEFGINGSTGNSDAMSFRTGANAKHTTDGHTLKLSFSYAFTETNNVETQNNALLSIRNDWDLFCDSLWSVFLQQTTEYDEFKAFDVRLSGNGGLGYYVVKEDNAKMKLRFGAGFSHEIGGTNDEVVAEAVFGADIETNISDRQKIEGTIDYLPEWAMWSDYRIESKFSWAIQLEDNLSLKLSIIDRYDSTPLGRLPNDLNYALLLLWKL